VLVKLLAFLLLPFLLFGLELSVQSGKENSTPFSIIHIEDTNKFLCESIRNDFDQTTQIVCVFAQRPSQSLKPLSNNFFDISFTTKGRNYFIVIKPTHKMQLFPMIFDLKKETTTFASNVKLSQKWMVVGFEEKIPFLSSEKLPSTAINFPITMRDSAFPFVGGLDIKGNPIHISKIKDVSDYLAIKRYYKAKDYEATLSLIDDVLQEYPDTVFKSELFLYRIRAYHFLEENTALLQSTKIFLRAYSSDENVPEVLAYTAKAYSSMGLYTDSDYFFERLFDEHPKNHYAHLGMIYKAEQLEASGNAQKALTYYEKALYATDDVDTASLAAFKMSSYYIEHNKPKDAKVYVDKILDANANYFATQLETSLELAMAFSDHLDYLTAARIVDAIYAKSPASNEYDEEMLRNEGIWLAKADQKEEALSIFNKYLDTYKYGEYVEEIQEAKDALFFENLDANLSAKIKEYDTLMQTYANDSIGDKALYKKAKLLCDSGEFRATLDLNNSLSQLDSTLYPDVDTLIDEAAQGLMQQSLEKKQCKEVITLSKTYNITLSQKWDKELFDCAFKGADFTLAKETVSRHLKEKNLETRMDWLYRYIQTDFATGNYSEVTQAAKELVSLSKMEKTDSYDEVRRILFDAYQRLGDKEGMIAAIADIEDAFGLVFKDSERYTQMVTLAQGKKNNQMIVNYAKKVMTLQSRAKAYSQTPYIEFTLSQAYINLSEDRQALEVIKSLDDKKLSDATRARQKYQLGSLLQKEGKKSEAKIAYEASVKADANSAWGKLSQDTLALF